MPKVFISYRRDDTSGYAGRLFDRLSEPIGRENVFMDVSAIGGGADFVDAIQQAVASCDVFVLLIGKRWLAGSGDTGASRLEDPGDFVRLEVGTALERGIPVIPLLIGGATMPGPDELPADLRQLSRRNALELSDTRWEFDVAKLLEAIGNALGLSRTRWEIDVGRLLEAIGVGEVAAPAAAPPPRRRWRSAGVAAVLLLLAVATAVWLARRDRADAPREAAIEEAVAATVPVVGVLAPRNLSGDEALDWLGKGIAALVRDNLSQSRHLAPAPAGRMDRLSSSASDELGLLEAAGAEGVGFVVSGEILPAAGGLTVTARLLDTALGTDVLSRRFDGLTADGLPQISEQIANLVRQGLDVPRTERVDIFAADFPTSNPAAYEAYVEGLGEFLRFRYPQAERAFEAALALAPDFTMARYRLAYVQAASGKMEEGLENIAAAAAEATQLGDRERLYVQAAQKYFSGSYEDAIALYRELVDRFPYDGEARQFLAELYYQTRSYDEEVAELLALSRLDPDSTVVWGMLGEAYREMGQLDKAAAAVARQVELDPQSANAHHSLGLVHQARGELDLATSEYERSLEIDPQLHFATLDLARVEVLQGRRSRAEKRLAELISKADTPPRFRRDAGIAAANLLRAAGRFAGAGDVLRSLETEFRGGVLEAWALSIRGLCHLELGQTAAAAELIDLAVERSPGRPTRYLFARGLLELQRRAWDRLEETGSGILATPDPGSEPGPKEVKAAAYLRGEAALARGDPARARAAFERAIRGEGTPYAVYELGWARALLAAGEPRAALAAARAAGVAEPVDSRMELELDRVRALLLQAEIHERLGDGEASAQHARQFLAIWNAADAEHPDLERARRLAARR